MYLRNFSVEVIQGPQEEGTFALGRIHQVTEFYKTYVLLEDLVRLATVRLRIKCEFEEMKGEMGPNHYEGRNWLGFHHHGVLCMAACAFLVAERARLSPQNLLLSSSPLGYPEVPVRGGCRCF